MELQSGSFIDIDMIVLRNFGQVFESSVVVFADSVLEPRDFDPRAGRHAPHCVPDRARLGQFGKRRVGLISIINQSIAKVNALE